MPGWALAVMFVLLGVAIGLTMRMVVRLLVYRGENGSVGNAVPAEAANEQTLRDKETSRDHSAEPA